MIIFDLDGTLANCEHRRHFVDGSKNSDYFNEVHSVEIIQAFECDEDSPKPRYKHKITGNIFKPDWKCFYEACDKDEPIQQTIDIYSELIACDRDVVIWSGRCESVRNKTEEWLIKNIYQYLLDPDNEISQLNNILKMRPIGDYTPDDQLKERWLDEAIAQGKTIEFVFDDRPKVIRIWRRRGIFVFNCCQHDEEF